MFISWCIHFNNSETTGTQFSKPIITNSKNQYLDKCIIEG